MTSMHSAHQKIARESSRKLAEADPRTRDHIVQVVGRARKTLPLKAARVAKLSGHSEQQESKIRNGQRMSEASRAAIAIYLAAEEEAASGEQEGVIDAMVEVTLRTVSMWPKLERLSTEQLRDELATEIAAHETRHNSVCNNLDSAYLHKRTLDKQAMEAAHIRQARSSIRICAIVQVLSRRTER
jgi:hypothetical protein